MELIDKYFILSALNASEGLDKSKFKENAVDTIHELDHLLNGAETSIAFRKISNLLEDEEDEDKIFLLDVCEEAVFIEKELIEKMEIDCKDLSISLLKDRSNLNYWNSFILKADDDCKVAKWKLGLIKRKVNRTERADKYKIDIINTLNEIICRHLILFDKLIEYKYLLPPSFSEKKIRDYIEKYKNTVDCRHNKYNFSIVFDSTPESILTDFVTLSLNSVSDVTNVFSTLFDISNWHDKDEIKNYFNAFSETELNNKLIEIKSNHKRILEILSMETAKANLLEIESRLLASFSTIKVLDAKFRRKEITPEFYFDKRKAYVEDNYSDFNEISKILNENGASDFADVFGRIINLDTTNEEQEVAIRKKLILETEKAEEKGWIKSLKDKVSQHKGDIIDVAIKTAIAIGTALL